MEGFLSFQSSKAYASTINRMLNVWRSGCHVRTYLEFCVHRVGNATECTQYEQFVLSGVFALCAARCVHHSGAFEMERIVDIDWIDVRFSSIAKTCNGRYGSHVAGVGVSFFVGNLQIDLKRSQ